MDLSFVKVPLVPDPEALALPFTPHGELEFSRRNYASQIFQIAALNDAVQRHDPHRRYIQRPGDNYRSGEYVQQEGSTLTAGELTRGIPFQGLELSEVARIGTSLGLGSGYLFAHPSALESPEGLNIVNSTEELIAGLQVALNTRNFPLIMEVDLHRDLFSRIGGGQQGDGGHVFSVTSYDPVAQTVNISNQWGPEDDWQNVPVASLFDALRINPLP